MLIVPLLVAGLGAAFWLGRKASGRLDTQGGFLRLGAIALAAGVLLAAFAYWFPDFTVLFVMVIGFGGMVVIMLNTIEVGNGQRRR